MDVHTPSDSSVFFIQGDSKEVCKTWDKGEIKLLFIDGDHSYEGVKADWENYGPMCKVVGFHDIDNKNEPGCVRLWNELKAQHRFLEIIDKPGELGIGIIFREPV